jgi:hypothetical protein
VRNEASTIAATIAESRSEVAVLIKVWMDHPDYRMRYSAIDAAYRVGHEDNAALFELAVHRHANDDQAWVRGIVADYLAEWVVSGGKEGYTRRLKPFKNEVISLLHDCDMWARESMVYLVRQLRKEGVDVFTSLGEPIGGLLGRVAGWETLERPELQSALDALKRA